jgi:hypothetical protein
MACTPQQSRLNAQKSTGPRTDVGKARVGRNALKHGILAKRPPLLMGEDEIGFAALLKSLAAHHQSIGPTEELIIGQIAMCHVQQRRLWAYHAAYYEQRQLERHRKTEFPLIEITPPIFGNTLSGFGTYKEQAIALEEELRELRGAIGDIDAELGTTLSAIELEGVEDLADSWRTELKGQAADKAAELYRHLNSQKKSKKAVRTLLEELKPLIEGQIAQAEMRLHQITEIDTAIAACAQTISRMDDELDTRLDKYNLRIQRDLDAAYDRLFRLQKERRTFDVAATVVN